MGKTPAFPFPPSPANIPPGDTLSGEADMRRTFWLGLLAAATLMGVGARADQPIPVTPDNFARAESDLRFSAIVKSAGLGKFQHQRAAPALDKQSVPRIERDLLVSPAVFDLDAGPVTITLPDPGKRFLSLQLIDEDGYSAEVDYGAGTRVLRKDRLGTRHALALLRIGAIPGDAPDTAAANALQDEVKVEQPSGPGVFETPNWDAASQVDVRVGLRVLAETLRDSKRMFGPRGKVDPVRFLIGAATAWGGAPESDLLILDRTPPANDGQTVHRLALRDVPVDGFWSVSVTNNRGFLVANPQGAYTLTGATAKAGPDGAAIIQFGGCDGTVVNCLPTPPDWILTVRLYRPRPEVLSGIWSFPELMAVAPPQAVAPAPAVTKAAASAPTAAPSQPAAAAKRKATAAPPARPKLLH